MVWSEYKKVDLKIHKDIIIPTTDVIWEKILNVRYKVGALVSTELMLLNTYKHLHDSKP